MPLGALIGAGASIAGGLLGKSSTDKANKKNIALQKEFAQHGIQWKVDDARRAGIHPLYALGAQTNSFSPSVVGDTSLASGLASAGQDISRAVEANSPASTRDRIYTDRLQALTLQKFGLENELLASQIAKTRAQLGPSIPTDDLTTVRAFGKDIVPNPGFSDAQKWEDRYHELGGYVGGALNVGADFYQNRSKKPAPQTLRRVLRYLQSVARPGDFGPMP